MATTNLLPLHHFVVWRPRCASVENDFCMAAVLLTVVVVFAVRVVADRAAVCILLRRILLTGARIDTPPSRRAAQVQALTGRGRFAEDALLHDAALLQVAEASVMVHATAHIDDATVVPTCGDRILGMPFPVARATIIVAGDAHKPSMRCHLWRAAQKNLWMCASISRIQFVPKTPDASPARLRASQRRSRR